MYDKEQIFKDVIDELLNAALYKLEKSDAEVMETMRKVTALEDRFSDAKADDPEINKLIKEHFEDLHDLTRKQFRCIYVQGAKDIVELLIKGDIFQRNRKLEQNVEQTQNSTISDLYNGKISPRTTKIKNKYLLKGREVCKYEDELVASLTETQKEIFTKFTQADSELNDISNEEQFTKGYKLGGKLTIEMLQKDDETKV